MFSAYLFLLCGFKVMCLPNLIISDPDFHLHVGGLLNPIPGKLLNILPVCVRSFLKSSSVLRSLPEAVSALTGMLIAQMYLDKHSVVHKAKGCSYTSVHRFKHMKEHTPIPLFPSCFLCSSVSLLSFVLIRCTHFNSTLNPLLLEMKSFICLSICHAALLIPLFFCSFFFLPGPFPPPRSSPLVLLPFPSSFLSSTSSLPSQTVSLKSVDGMGLFAPVRWRRKRE